MGRWDSSSIPGVQQLDVTVPRPCQQFNVLIAENLRFIRFVPQALRSFREHSSQVYCADTALFRGCKHFEA
jgi:hypothetical protein